jgi:hypothetical protein
MLRLWKVGLIFLTFFVALAVAGREGPEFFSLADDPSNDGDVIVQATEVEAALSGARTLSQTGFTQIFADRLSCGISSLLTASTPVPSPGRPGTTLLSYLKLRRV